MPVDAQGRLHVFVLNVGQADASVVVTPGNEVVVIDAVKPDKLTRLLGDLGAMPVRILLDLPMVTALATIVAGPVLGSLAG